MSRLTNITAKTTKPVYSDFTTSFLIHPQKQDVLKVTNENSVRAAIKALISTNRGERLFQPSIGSSVRELLFENMTPQTKNELKRAIMETIEQHEPRAKLQSVLVSENYEQQSYTVTIVFSVINSQTIVTLPIILERLR